jgi:hypothetical protein
MTRIQCIKVTAINPPDLKMWTAKNRYKQVVTGISFILRNYKNGDGGAIIGTCVVGKKVLELTDEHHEFMKNHSDKYKQKLSSPNLVYNKLSKIRIFDEEFKLCDLSEWIQKPRDIQQFQDVSDEDLQMLLLEHKNSNY